MFNQENANHFVFNVKKSLVLMYSQDFLGSHRFVIHFTAQGLGSIVLENYTRVTWQNFTVTELCLNYLFVDSAFTRDISLMCCYCLFQNEADYKIKAQKDCPLRKCYSSVPWVWVWPNIFVCVSMHACVRLCICVCLQVCAWKCKTV